MSIEASSVLVELNLSVWTGQKIDRDVTAKAVNDSHATHGAGQFKKNLMAGSGKRKEISDFAQACRNWHAQRTLPWADKGPRILPTSLFMEYKKEANDRKSKFDALVQEFMRQYPIHVQTAQQNLGTMYNPDDYPPLEEIALKFEFKLVFSPVATAGDFRIQAHADDLRELRDQYEDAFQGRIKDAMEVPLQRMHDLIVSMSDKLTEPAEGEKKRYHDSLVTNAQEMVEMVKHLNITGDRKLEAARAALEQVVSGLDIIDIKANEETRLDVKEKLDKVLGDFW